MRHDNELQRIVRRVKAFALMRFREGLQMANSSSSFAEFVRCSRAGVNSHEGKIGTLTESVIVMQRNAAACIRLNIE
jgi:hypothetical protein